MLEFDPERVDAAYADVYSLAKTLWALAAHERYPLPGHLRARDARSLRAVTDDPRAGSLDALVERATDHEPANRPSMNEVAAILQDWLGQQSQPQVGDLEELDAVVARAMDTLVDQRLAERERQERAGRTDQAFEALESGLKSIFDALPELGTSWVENSPDSIEAILQIVTGEFGGPVVESSRQRLSYAYLGEEHDGVRLAVAISARLFENGELELAAGIDVSTLPLTLGQPPYWWNDRHSAQAGSIEAAQAVETLTHDTQAAAREAIKTFADVGSALGK